MARATCSITRCRSLSFRPRRRLIPFPLFRHDRRRRRPSPAPFLLCRLFCFPSFPGHPDDAPGFFPGPDPVPVVGLELIPDVIEGQGVLIPITDEAIRTGSGFQMHRSPLNPDEPQGLGDGDPVPDHVGTDPELLELLIGDDQPAVVLAPVDDMFLDQAHDDHIGGLTPAQFLEGRGQQHGPGEPAPLIVMGWTTQLAAAFAVAFLFAGNLYRIRHADRPGSYWSRWLISTRTAVSREATSRVTT